MSDPYTAVRVGIQVIKQLNWQNCVTVVVTYSAALTQSMVCQDGLGSIGILLVRHINIVTLLMLSFC